MNLKSCIKSMRLRTLPLSLAGIVTGIALASSGERLSFPVVITLILTASFLQILSNLSNELGDTLSGTDTVERQGIRYSIQDGEMTIVQMKHLIKIVVALCCISGTTMAICSFHKLFSLQTLSILVFGAVTIWAAMHYTLGNNPYGYRGWGDVSVFVFFGLATVMGGGYICSHTFSALWLLPASAVGLWSIGVLNVNNIRDMKTDAATRTTVAIKLGLKNARIYQTALITSGWLLMLIYYLLTASNWKQWLCFVTVPLFVLHVRGVWKREERSLDPMLPLLVMTTFVTSVLFAVTG